VCDVERVGPDELVGECGGHVSSSSNVCAVTQIIARSHK
jgi:hypothetical protein